MLIGGLQKTSLIDYPGKISAIVFTQGCNFKCSYCHNPELVNPKLFGKYISEEDIIDFLEKRRGKLDAVVITGGEPTIQNDLLEFMKRIKELGFLVKLDTNGSNPDVIEKALNQKLVDFIAMDIKAPLEKYKKIINITVDKKKIENSIKLIIKSGIDYEFRTTVLKNLLSEKDFDEMGKMINNAKKYVIQQFVDSKILDKNLTAEKYSDSELNKIQNKLRKYVDDVAIR